MTWWGPVPHEVSRAVTQQSLPIYHTIIDNHLINQDQKSVKDLYVNMAFAQNGYLESSSDIQIRTHRLFPMESKQQWYTLSWLWQITMNIFTPINKGGPMSMKEMYSINHIAMPLAHFASHQMQYLWTFIHVFAREVSYRNNVSKYIILHQKHDI